MPLPRRRILSLLTPPVLAAGPALLNVSDDLSLSGWTKAQKDHVNGGALCDRVIVAAQPR